MRRTRSEHGVVAALFAVMVSTGVVIAMGALVIDVGQIALERQELQTGADAASWTIASRCVQKPADCTMAKQSLVASDYANRNTKDGSADAQICLSNQTALCTAWKSPGACPPTTVTGGTSVEVRTSTRTGTSTLLPPAFASAMSGSVSSGVMAGACGRVAWGPPGITKVLAMGISMCDWKRMTANGSTFYGPLSPLLSQLGLYSVLGLPAPTAAAESAIPMVTSAKVLLPLPSCTSPIDLTEPRGWVWLADNDLSPPDANCELTLKVGDLPRSFLLSGLTQGIPCAGRLQAQLASRQPVLVPIYDEVQGLLSLAPAYRIAGFAPFVFTGYTSLLGGLLSGVGSLLNGGLPGLLQSALCGLSQCILGYFTKTLVPLDSPTFGTGPNFGATVIGRTG
ncbi:pilus assembly protein TadG-related protein [Paractinoplanes hotanensis]|uniref:Tad domain-containing protein n=1 Tax=Paractinoplanes hotanensis TaxID=2906497 RepID=A0ABT0XX88_9ACTN|nr:pilus assembly protein TadG-related protein [Actinoplanes hotanensis]MCM4077853.1 Tad domain-containing protein [Actinoplanes hotanensis]